MPPGTAPTVRRDGYLSEPGPDRIAWSLAVCIALGAAIAFEWIAARTPVPPGGDEGTWLLLAYPYVGITAPASVHLFSYPPLSLPFLGLAVVLAGGPLNGARLFVGAVIALLGISAYQLGRAMFRWRAIALLFELALFVQPDFQQLYYFGAYPNLFGFVFLFLAVAFGLRFVRSRRDAHLALFWGAATAAILSHALVAVVLVALLAIAGVALLALRRFPRELLTTATGRIGAASFAVLGLLYYAGSGWAGTSRPNYLYTTILTPSQSTQQLGDVFHAFYLEPLSVLLHVGGFAFTYETALALLWGLSALLVVGFGLVRWRRPVWATDRVVALLAWFLAVFSVALASWYLNLTADYRRFTYFLYPANLLLLALIGDGLLAALWARWPVEAATPPRPVPWRRAPRSAVIGGTFLAVGVVLLVGGAAYTLPAAEQFENQNTRAAHGPSFLQAMNAIASSGIGGAILSMTPVVDRWPATLTGHDLYEVRPPTGYTYTANNLETDELAALSASYHDALTNGQVVVALPGASPSTYNASPLFGYYWEGLLRPLVVVAPGSIEVSLANGTTVPVNITGGAPSIAVASNGPGGAVALVLNLSGPGFVLTETIAALPSSSTAQVAFRAIPTGPSAIARIQLDLSATPFGAGGATVSGPTTFTWTSVPVAGALPTYGSVDSEGRASLTNTSTVELATPSDTLTVNLSTPAATNPVDSLSGLVEAPALWQSWDVRFILLGTGAPASEAAYLEAEYGASVFAEYGVWTVLLWSGPVSLGWTGAAAVGASAAGEGLR